MVASPQSSQAAGTLLFQGRLEVRLTSSGSCCGAKDTDGREVAHSRSPPLCQVRGALGWLPPRKPAGPRRVGPSKLRTEISAGLGLDSDLPRQLAASLRSARVAGARHLLSGTSPQRDASRFSLPHLLSRTANRRTGVLRPTTVSPQPAAIAVQEVGPDPPPPRAPPCLVAPPTSRRPVSTRADSSGPTLSNPQPSSEIWLLIGCLQSDNLVNLGALVRTLVSDWPSSSQLVGLGDLSGICQFSLS